jgi:hypothetical protein
MNNGGEVYENLKKAGIGALKMGRFDTVDELLPIIEKYEKGEGYYKIAETQGLFCAACHKPKKEN